MGYKFIIQYNSGNLFYIPIDQKYTILSHASKDSKEVFIYRNKS